HVTGVQTCALPISGRGTAGSVVTVPKTKVACARALALSAITRAASSARRRAQADRAVGARDAGQVGVGASGRELPCWRDGFTGSSSCATGAAAVSCVRLRGAGDRHTLHLLRYTDDRVLAP